MAVEQDAAFGGERIDATSAWLGATRRGFGIELEEDPCARLRVGQQELGGLVYRAGETDRGLAVVLEEIRRRAEEQPADQRDVVRPRQHPHVDAGGLDLAEAGIEVGERIDHAALQRDAGRNAGADRDPLHVLVGIDAEIAEHRAGHRIVRGAEIGYADLPALRSSQTLMLEFGFTATSHL